MTLYKDNQQFKELDADGVYSGSQVFKQIYAGSNLIYQKKHTVIYTITYYGSQGASVSGENFWDSTIGVYNRTASGSITYSSPQRAGVWTFNYKFNRQQHTADVYFAIDIRYTDGTQERVYYKADFPNDNADHIYTGTFNASKPWVGYNISCNDRGTYNVYVYSLLGPINYITTTYSQIEPV